MPEVSSGARYTLMRLIMGFALVSVIQKRNFGVVTSGKQMMRRWPIVVIPSPSSARWSLRPIHLPLTKASSENFLTLCPCRISSSTRNRLKVTGFLKSTMVVVLPSALAVVFRVALSARSVLNTSSIIFLKAMPRRLSLGCMRPLGAIGKLSRRVELRPTDL